ncbi:ankyrin [Neocallimastix californiae]|uniref:Ankyrin n=1 Tax=Neocallimastix californiae TaxID=1754190 RepID=A0A1Y2D8I6_9FUNG|nr:ankyrin [Neocallimastix californiae]|eukprot:ORY55570.1 ankyrin [Neocallimastix californiae]
MNYANNNNNSNNNITLEVNEKNNDGWYPLLAAIDNNNFEMVELLIDNANRNNIILELNEKNKNEYFPVFGIMNNNHIKMFKSLLYYIKEKNIRLVINENDIENVISNNNGNYNIKDVSEINIEFIKLLHKYKSIDQIKIIFSEKSKLLEMFNEVSNNEKIEEEKMKNEKIKRKTNNNDTPLTYECRNGNIEEVEKLINNGKDINEKNKYGDTPLIIACKNNNMELVKCLLRHKEIDIDLKSDYDINALMVACYFKNKDLVNCLIDNNANIEIQDSKNNLPLHIAYENENDILYKNNNYENSHSHQENPMLFNNIFNIINRSICKIEIDEISGTGFFIKIPIPSKENAMCGLMTNNHILNENMIKLNKSFRIYMAYNEKYGIDIKINKEDFVFTSELIDVTFIELNNDIINEIDPIFLNPSNEDAKVNESVLIYQYAQAKYSLAHGNITDIKSFNYYHDVIINEGSSGSPLLNKNCEVVGMHKSKVFIKNSINRINVAVRYSEVEYAIGISFNNINIYGIEKAKKSARLLSDTEIEILNDYGLQLKLTPDDVNKVIKNINELYKNEEKKKETIEEKREKKIEKKLQELEIIKKSLFYCTFSENLLFYRTNYTWYIALLSKKRDKHILISNLNDIKKLNWYPIIPKSEKLIKRIESKIKYGYGREYILITWLKLTELMYL